MGVVKTELCLAGAKDKNSCEKRLIERWQAFVPPHKVKKRLGPGPAPEFELIDHKP